MPGKHQGDPEPLTLISFNIHKGSGLGVLEAGIRDAGRPDVAAYQEGFALDGNPDGYRNLRPDPERFKGNDRVRDVGLAVKRGIKVVGRVSWAVPGGEWRYEDNHNDPRVWIRAVLEKGGVVSEVWVVHRCPLGPRPPKKVNRKAWKAEHRFLVKKVREVRKAHPDRRIVIVGDWNTRVGKNPGHRFSIESLAKKVGGTLHMHGIDGALVVGGGDYDVRQMSNAHGSDHKPVSLRARK